MDSCYYSKIPGKLTLPVKRFIWLIVWEVQVQDVLASDAGGNGRAWSIDRGRITLRQESEQLGARQAF